VGRGGAKTWRGSRRLPNSSEYVMVCAERWREMWIGLKQGPPFLSQRRPRQNRARAKTCGSGMPVQSRLDSCLVVLICELSSACASELGRGCVVERAGRSLQIELTAVAANPSCSACLLYSLIIATAELLHSPQLCRITATHSLYAPAQLRRCCQQLALHELGDCCCCCC
jgi:hypothetical protein